MLPWLRLRLRTDLEARFVRREVRVEPIRRVRQAVIDVLGPEYWKVRPLVDDDLETVEAEVVYHPYVDVLAEAQGVMFGCPKCWSDDPPGPIGCHKVLCWFADRGVPDDAQPGPGRWTPSDQSTSLDDLTFVPSGARSHSVLLLGGCGWHGYVSNGDAS